MPDVEQFLKEYLENNSEMVVTQPKNYYLDHLPHRTIRVVSISARIANVIEVEVIAIEGGSQDEEDFTVEISVLDLLAFTHERNNQ